MATPPHGMSSATWVIFVVIPTPTGKSQWCEVSPKPAVMVFPLRNAKHWVARSSLAPHRREEPWSVPLMLHPQLSSTCPLRRWDLSSHHTLHPTGHSCSTLTTAIPHPPAQPTMAPQGHQVGQNQAGFKAASQPGSHPAPLASLVLALPKGIICLA